MERSGIVLFYADCLQYGAKRNNAGTNEIYTFFILDVYLNIRAYFLIKYNIIAKFNIISYYTRFLEKQEGKSLKILH
jgi:hypothetical protein